MKYLAIARLHHYPKNLLVIIGFLLACFHRSESATAHEWWLVVIGTVATCFIASSNYILNGILDAGSDRFHPRKKNRPLVAGEIMASTAYLEWFVLAATGLTIAACLGQRFFVIAMIFQLMAIVYNVPPVRLKDIPYVDVLCEAINSPLRILLGWVIVLPSDPPGLELMLAFWAAGAWAMARKRLHELRFLENPATATAYRRSFSHYNQSRLLASMLVFASLALIFCLSFFLSHFEI